MAGTQVRMHGTVRCVDGIPGHTCMVCDALKAFEVNVYFSAVSDANAAEAAKQTIQKIRANPDMPVFVSVDWIDGAGPHRRWVEVKGDRARVLDDDTMPVQ